MSRTTLETTDITGEDNSLSMDIDDQPLSDPKTMHSTPSSLLAQMQTLSAQS